MSSSSPTRPADVFLERSLLANFVIHGVAMVTMALFLARMLPGGGEADTALRVANIAAHPWLFRVGWLPWQLCAVSDIWLAIALVRVRWIPRVATLVVLLLTLIAVAPDQYAQAVWVTRGVELAQAAHTPEGLARYLEFEAPTFVLTAAWGALFYTLAAIGWTVCLGLARLLSRPLLILSCVAWTVMVFVTTVLLVPPELRIAPELVAAGNAVGFLLLEVWYILATEAVLRRRRPFTSHGRDAPWIHPWQGIVGRAIEALANSRFVAALCAPLPTLAMRSDITDVIYVNYLVPAERVLPLIPEGLELQRLGPHGSYALFTFLSYRHGHFGFRIMGPLRRLMPSPVHSNWRIHVRDPQTGIQGIFFVTNAIANTLFALAGRMLARGMPMHLLQRGEIVRDGDGTLHLTLDPGTGSAPDAEATLKPADEPRFEGAWKECFATFRDFLAYAVPQDRAMSTQPWAETVTRQEIDLGIPLDVCEPLAGKVSSRAAEALVGAAEPVCFRVPKVLFRFEKELYSSTVPLTQVTESPPTHT